MRDCERGDCQVEWLPVPLLFAVPLEPADEEFVVLVVWLPVELVGLFPFELPEEEFVVLVV